MKINLFLFYILLLLNNTVIQKTTTDHALSEFRKISNKINNKGGLAAVGHKIVTYGNADTGILLAKNDANTKISEAIGVFVESSSVKLSQMIGVDINSYQFDYLKESIRSITINNISNIDIADSKIYQTEIDIKNNNISCIVLLYIHPVFLYNSFEQNLISNDSELSKQLYNKFISDEAIKKRNEIKKQFEKIIK